MLRRLVKIGTGAILVVAVAVWIGAPYARAASLIVRAASLGGYLDRLARHDARPVTAQAPHMVPTRYGPVPARFYAPTGGSRRSVLLIPGIHSRGIDEPRLVSLAGELAGTGVRVMTMALPDLQAYRITPHATDVIEDAVSWMVTRGDLAPDGRVGIVGVSFAGGLALSAASRPSLRGKVAYVLSFGGHGDLPRVMRYLATGEAPQVPGLAPHPPHDYGVAVILYGLADRGVVPPDQVEGLRKGIETFLLASQLDLERPKDAKALFAKARDMAATLEEPSRTYLTYVNDRAVTKLGPILVPHLRQLGADDPALSPERVDTPTSAPIFLLHGHDDTVIPAAETVLLGQDLQRKGANVRVLLSGLVTHAQVNPEATVSDVVNLVRFWKGILQL